MKSIATEGYRCQFSSGFHSGKVDTLIDKFSQCLVVSRLKPRVVKQGIRSHSVFRQAQASSDFAQALHRLFGVSNGHMQPCVQGLNTIPAMAVMRR
jgi:hypothetical protein